MQNIIATEQFYYFYIWIWNVLMGQDLSSIRKIHIYSTLRGQKSLDKGVEQKNLAFDVASESIIMYTSVIIILLFTWLCAYYYVQAYILR